MLKFFKVVVGTEFCGTDQMYIAQAEKEDDLFNLANEIAFENASGFDYIVWGWGNGADDVGVSQEEFDEAIEEYYQNVTVDIQEIIEQEFNKYLEGGVELL